MITLSLEPGFSFPGVTVDRNKTEFETFASNYRAVDHAQIIELMANVNEVKKSAEISNLHRALGNQFYNDDNFKVALEFYSVSLAFAPHDSVEYALAIANRSAVFFAVNLYKECLLDIEKLFGSKYPENNFFKIYIRQSKCYSKLEQNAKAQMSCARARLNLDTFRNTFSNSQYRKIKLLIRNLLINIRPYNVEIIENNENPNFALKNGKNEKFLNASNAVKLMSNEIKGRYVVAKTDIAQGDILFVEKPCCAVRVDDLITRYTYCSKCLAYKSTCIPCKECIVHFYCSNDCRQAAWDKGHKWECCGERNNILTCEMRLLLNLIFAASRDGFKTDLDKDASDVYGNKDNNFAFISQLVTNKNMMTEEELVEFTKFSIWIVLYLKKFTNYFGWLQAQPDIGTGKTMAELYDFIGGHLLKLCMQTHCNSDQIVDVSLKSLDIFNLNTRTVGFGLYISSAMINHSCIPNALVTFHNMEKVVRATKKIKKNTEITIDYTNFSRNLTQVDRRCLLDKYKFTCTCAKCSNPLRELKKPWLCERCQGKAFYFSDILAKCTNCQRIFNINYYKIGEQQLITLYMTAFCTSNSRIFESIQGIMKKIYHKQHIEYANYYTCAYDFYISEPNIVKCLNVCKTFVQFCEDYKEIDETKLQAYLRLMNATAVYYGLMKENRVAFRPTIPNDYWEVLHKTKKLLEYFSNPRFIKIYEDSFNDFFASFESS